jgi:hypothetical protein
MDWFPIVTVLSAVVLLDVLALRFGVDSRDYKRAVWW